MYAKWPITTRYNRAVAGVQSVITGIATGVTVYATTHPKFKNFARKLQSFGYDALKQRLQKAGLSDNMIDDFCEKFGVKKVIKAISNIDEFWAKIPIAFRKQVQNAFDAGTATLKYANDNLILYRHISKDGAEKSFWYARTMESPTNARKVFALPNDNTAEWIVKVKVKKGTPYVEGRVASQVGKTDFGSYATGGGNQLYFLQENIIDIDVIIEKTKNTLK